MKRLMIADCGLRIFGRATFPSIGNWNSDFFQALEKLVVSVSNAWKPLCFSGISTTANPQSAICIPHSFGNSQFSIRNPQFFSNRKFF